MAQKYLLTTHLEPVPATTALPVDQPVVEVLSPQEFARMSFITRDLQDVLQHLATVENTYLDAFPQCFLGSFAVPVKNNMLQDPLCFAFYLDHTHLVFLDEDDTCELLLKEIAHQDAIKELTVANCLYEFIKILMRDDLSFLATLEDRMEDVEEAIIDQSLNTSDREILKFRRKLLRLDTYYQQLVDMISGLADNENRLLSREEARRFKALERQAERLLKRSLTLKEYSLQLRELYQMQIDLQQNTTMQFFTVITALFAPLTLLTGWFGMNFAHMPGIDAAWGYQALIVVALVIVLVELIIFKRKGWL